MFLIMSAAYIDQELKAEFGQIPPAFLPLANQRLFQHQIGLIHADTPGYLSLPASYEIPFHDKCWLEARRVQVVRVADDLTLGESLIAVLNQIATTASEEPLQVLFGDTLLQGIPEGHDVIAISDAANGYEWTTIDRHSIGWQTQGDKDQVDSGKNVICGYFHFSRPQALARYIGEAGFDFIQGLDRYFKQEGLSSVYIDDWLDFGHVSTYYRSKMEFTTQRSFNELTITPRWVEKSGHITKMKAEVNWFRCIPELLKVYTPQFLGSYSDKDRFFYRLEYLHLTALNELYVFSEMPLLLWQKIIVSCFDFIAQCQLIDVTEPIHTTNTNELFSKKTALRLQQFCSSKQVHPDQPWVFNGGLRASISELVAFSQHHLPSPMAEGAIMHGDLCFSNILYDFRTGHIKVIDPRGLTVSGELTVYGDQTYDLAKLSHSVIGMYDWIMAGYHSTSIDYCQQTISFSLNCRKQHDAVQQLFLSMIEAEFGLTRLNLLAMQIQLFLSMLPLHADDTNRQQALFANAFRLYGMMKEQRS